MIDVRISGSPAETASCATVQPFVSAQVLHFADNRTFNENQYANESSSHLLIRFSHSLSHIQDEISTQPALVVSSYADQEPRYRAGRGMRLITFNSIIKSRYIIELFGEILPVFP